MNHVIRKSAIAARTRRLVSTMSNTFVKRTTLFKIPKEHIDTVLKEYETLRKNAVRVRWLPSLADCLNLTRRAGRQTVYRLQRSTKDHKHRFAAQRGVHDILAVDIQEQGGS